MVLTRTEMEAKPAFAIEEITVPEWGGSVFVRSMSASDRDSWEAAQYYANGKDFAVNRRALRARLLIRCLCDADGKRLYADDEEQIVGGMDSRAIDRLYDAAVRINRLRQQDLDELEKNSGAGPSGSSGSA